MVLIASKLDVGLSHSINPINCLIDDVIIGSTPSIVAGSWTSFTQSFTIVASKIIVLKLSGSVIIDQTTAISNIIITKKSCQYF